MTPFAISCLSVAILNLALAVFFFMVTGCKTRVYLLWCLFCVGVSLWSGGLGFLSTAETEGAATGFLLVHYFGAIFLLAIFYDFIHGFLNRPSHLSIQLIYVAGASLVILAMCGILVTVSPHIEFRFYTSPKPMYFLFLLYLVPTIGFTHYWLYRDYKESEGKRRQQIKLLFIGTGLGFVGGLATISPVYNGPSFPWAMPLVFIYLLTFSYAILKHRLLDIALFARDALTKITSLGIALVPLYIGIMLAHSMLTMELASLTRTISTLFASLLYFSIAITLLREPKNALSNYLIRFCLILGFWNSLELVLDLPFNYASVLLYRSAYGAGCLALIAWYTYWSHYLTSRESTGRQFQQILNITAGAMTAVSVATPYVLKGLVFDPHLKRPAMEIPGPGYALYSAWFIATILMIGVALYRDWRLNRGREARWPLFWMAFPYGMGLLAAAAYFLYVGGKLQQAWHPWLEMLMIYALLGSYLHHPSHLEKRRWAVYSTQVWVLAIPLLAGFLFTQGVAMHILAVAIILWLIPQMLKQTETSIQSWVDEHIFKGKFSYFSELGEIRNQAFRYVNLRELLEFALNRMVDALRLKAASLYLYDLTATAYVPIIVYPTTILNHFPTFSQNNPLIAALKKNDWESTSLDSQSYTVMGLTRESRTFAFFMLGEKEDGSALHAHDQKELQDLRDTLQQIIWYIHVLYEQSILISKFTHDDLRHANNLRQWIELIRGGAMGPITPELNKAFSVMDGDARLLETDINDLRQLMSILSQRLRGVYKMEDYDMSDLLLKILATYKVHADRQKIHLVSNLSESHLTVTGPLGLRGWGEPISIQHAIENLVSNALKFTPPGGTIRVDAKPLGHVLEVVVSDTGEGIPDSELPHIFEPFYQGKGREKMEKSTGLGLSIVKEIVAIHQGDINVESENGKGTIFYVRLPSTKSVLASAA